MAAQVGRVDLAKNFGQGLTLTPQGDFAIVQDTVESPDATQQWVQYLLQTNPRLSDGQGGFLTRPDDLFNPDWGAGGGTFVGEMVTDSLLHDIQARTLQALFSDPFVAKNPAPTVTLTDLGGGFVLREISFQTTTGQLITVPAEKLQIF